MCTCRAKSRSPSVVSLALALLAGAGALPAAAEDDAAALARLRGEIAALVKGRDNCHNVVQCRVLTMGFDDCGRPTRLVAYNNVTDIQGALEAKGAEYTFIEEEQQRGRPRPAVCAPFVKPVPVCHRNRCATGAENNY